MSTRSNLPQIYHAFIDREHSDNYRQEEIQALVKAIRARENRLVLGLPGMGVSNLLRFLVAKIDVLIGREITIAYLNCEALKDCLDPNEFFEKIARQLYAQGPGEDRREEKHGYERLMRLLSQIGGDPLSRVAIVVDQADRMLEAADRNFYRKLKALTDLNKRVCYIFAASPRLSNIVDPDNLLFAGRRLMVGRLNERDCANAITEEAQRLETKFDSAMQGHLAQLTGGHPGLLRAVSSAMVDMRLDSSPSPVVEYLLARADINYRCQKIWNDLDPSKQTALGILVAGQPDAMAKDTLAWLQDFGLVDNNQEGYRLFSPIFAGFTAAQQEIDSPGAITIVGGKVFKDNEEISLRPLEQKLLTCLMAKPGQVYPHDKIAWQVWDTYDVTPDMITGLVSQLRSRLGKEHIKTHWGRGYEFVA